jgi:hypothetical protein
MSQWGNRDSIQIQSVSVTEDSNAVVSASLDFVEANIVAGDTLFLANVGYKVAKIIDSGNLILDVAYEDSNGTVAARVQQSPKDIHTYGWGNVTTGANTINARNVYGVDRNEITVPENKDRGIGHTGWVHYRTHGTSQGGTRNISEVLVAMSKNFNANATGTLNLPDSVDDTVVADYRLYFLTQPTSQSNTAGNEITFTSAAVSDPAGASLTYQWYESLDGSTYTVVNDGDDYSGNTTNTLTVLNVSNVDGSYFRVTVASTTGGSVSNTSTAVTATES